jgi:hypothetical protein
MKTVLAMIFALLLVAAASAVPVEDAYVTRPSSSKQAPIFEIVDKGSGPTAAVIVARKALFEPYEQTVLQTSQARPRVIAFLINGQRMEELGGVEALMVPIQTALEQRGIRSACVVSCDDCVPLAAGLAASMEEVSSLVLMTGLPMPVVPVSKPVFLASSQGSAVLAAMDDAMKTIKPRLDLRGRGYTRGD